MNERIYACQGCGRTYAEYVNGCVACWDDELSIEANRAKYPRRKVVPAASLSDGGTPQVPEQEHTRLAAEETTP
jgi:predicted ATP-dependent serine protease